MKHLHNASGLVFECGELMEPDIYEVRRTYDMIVVTLWEGTYVDSEVPVVIGCYFGEYNAEHTDYLIERWLEQRAYNEELQKLVNNCEDIVDAYRLTNDGHLEPDREKMVVDTLKGLQRIRRAYHQS